MTTELAAPDEAADVWIDLICETFVKLSARRASDAPFHGEIGRETLGELEFSTVTASAQDVYRTRRFAATASDEYLLFSIQREGEGYVSQDGRTAHLHPGGIALYDSARPYSLHFPTDFRQLVVQLPKASVGIDDTRGLTADPHGVGTPGGVIAQFLVAMSEQLQEGGPALDPMVDHVLGSLSEILRSRSVAEEMQLPDQLLRRKAESIMRRDLADPGWSVVRLAAECHASVRTLYRVFPGGGVSSIMRGMRIDAAKQHLRAHPLSTVDAVALRCGFDSGSGFIRAFRAETGTTPRRFLDDSC
ncbi:helix-turn-helix domain-containing protein [Brevibacterium sp. FME17]|uniref:AraC-like ligand-binding domain-containing protein n=1 Tax=Brevibacterium sp. FME17 TaxID=2742606 RepID=UPI0018670629|nr:helix-turn-helix domain-containing protein [Brevibacterium sp. FME17]